MATTAKDKMSVASTQTLTGSYVVGDDITSRPNQWVSTYGEDVASLTLTYITGAAETNNSCEFKVEFSPDGTNWFQETKGTESSGVNVLTAVEHQIAGASAATTYKAVYNLQLVAKFMRVSFKETGKAANFGSIDCDITIGSGVSLGLSSISIGTITVDSEFPAAAALSDNYANPTTTTVGAMGMVWDGATWDRQLGDSTDGTLVNLGSNNDVTVSGDALTALQLIDDTVYVDGATFTLTTNKASAQGRYAEDPTSLTAVATGKIGVAKQDLGGRDIVTQGTQLDVTNDSVSTQPVEPSNVNTSAAAASLVVLAAAGTCYEIRGHSDKASAQYIQVHDASSLPADTAVPEDVFLVPADSNFSITYPQGKSFATGIVVSNSSTLATKIIGSADCWFSAEYLAA